MINDDNILIYVLILSVQILISTLRDTRDTKKEYLQRPHILKDSIYKYYILKRKKVKYVPRPKKFSDRVLIFSKYLLVREKI